MKLKHGIFSILVVLMSCAAGMACHQGFPVPADKVRVHIGAEPPTLNVITSTDMYASEVNNYLFDGLIDRNRDTLEFEPRLATRWEISPDKKTYTFYLRKDVKWHDGVLLTADDVVYSFELLQDPKVNDPHLKVYFQDIEKVTKLDDYTVQFHYRKIYFLGLSVCAMLPIVPKHLVEKFEDFEGSPFSRHPVGTGPYKFKEWVTNTRIVLERNDDYWGEKPAIREIEFKVIPDAAIGLQILKKGEIDVFVLTSVQWARQSNSEKFNKMFTRFAYPLPGYSYIGWNNNNPMFKDPLVRQAMTHLVDREKINQKINFGLGKIVTGPFFPFSKQYNTTIKPREFHLEKARELLKQAGWTDTDGDGVLDKSGQRFEFTFLYPSASKTSERIATILKETLVRVGIVMNITRIEWAAFLDKVSKREFDATNLAWGSPFESDPYQVFDISQVDKPGSSNFISFASQEASNLMKEARVEFDEQKRNRLYWRFHEVLDELQPYTFMFNQPALVAVSKRFTNVKVHKTGLNLLEWKLKEGQK